ncbi:MAG: efflux RND transporter periplasmic adaptor subunit, partial [Candidatus Omnitrophica bacterium]|nr:efflux RND transporter periplasmic adaptor subunit [Candidatus Omnitrophota bacterium]
MNFALTSIPTSRPLRAQLLCFCWSALLAMALWVSGCNRNSDAKPQSAVGGGEPAPVRVTEVTQRDMPLELAAIGAVESYSTIQVRARVSGEITKVWFQEGEEVRKDQILFTIDPRPYEVALQQARADLEKSRAMWEVAKAVLAKNRIQAENALSEMNRNSRLVDQGVVPVDEYERIVTNYRSLEAAARAEAAAAESASASIQVASAAIERARIELEYCTIRSPIDGRTGSLLVHRGNLVKENDTPALVVIHQIDPVFVRFTLPERHIPEIKETMRAGPLVVRALAPETNIALATGTLTFLDNTVNQKTGTIRLKGTFENRNRVLWPGQFVTVRVVVSVERGATVAP